MRKRYERTGTNWSDKASRRAYHRAYMRRQRAAERVANPPTRDRVLAALLIPRTIPQILRALGETYERPTVYYHLQRLAREGAIVIERNQRGSRDRSRYRYRRI